MHCVAGNDCWAVGEAENGELIIHWNGSSWSRAGPYGSIPDKTLYSVHCVAGNDCWAVGEDENGELIIHWNGSDLEPRRPYWQHPEQEAVQRALRRRATTAGRWARMKAAS